MTRFLNLKVLFALSLTTLIVAAAPIVTFACNGGQGGC